MERRSIKVRLYPTSKQNELMQKSFGADRWIFNRALTIKKDRWEMHKENVSWVEISKMVTLWKKTEELAWLNLPSRSVLEQSLKKLDRAYQNFFKHGSGFPNFKKKGNRESFVLTEGSRLIGDGEIKLPKMGEVKIRGLRSFSGKIKNVTITKTPNGHIYASWSVEDVEKTTNGKNEKVGIDVGLSLFAVISNGKKIENPKFLKLYEEKLKYYQRRMSKARKGGCSFHKWRKKANCIYQKISNLKNDFTHKLTFYLTKNHGQISVERLKIKSMIKNRNFSKSIAMASWGEFFRQLEYKSRWYGCELKRVDPYNTTRECNHCEYVHKKAIPMNIRAWNCPRCGMLNDRDLNAAININKKGQDIVLKACREIGFNQLSEACNAIFN